MLPVKTEGGLALWWDNSVKVQVLFKSKNLFDTTVTLGDESNIHITWFYDPLKKEGKSVFWNNLNNMAGSIKLPWLCAFDFNEFFRPPEKEGGNL